MCTCPRRLQLHGQIHRLSRMIKFKSPRIHMLTCTCVTCTMHATRALFLYTRRGQTRDGETPHTSSALGPLGYLGRYEIYEYEYTTPLLTELDMSRGIKYCLAGGTSLSCFFRLPGLHSAAWLWTHRRRVDEVCKPGYHCYIPGSFMIQSSPHLLTHGAMLRDSLSRAGLRGYYS